MGCSLYTLKETKGFSSLYLPRSTNPLSKRGIRPGLDRSMKKKGNLQLAYERNARAVYRQNRLTKKRNEMVRDYTIDKILRIEKNQVT